ncbi:class I SAM-dependent methyltransferase [Desulfovibrio caledoniensis]
MRSSEAEIVFDKYEKKGAYHWDLYNAEDPNYYQAIVDLVVDWAGPDLEVLDMGCGDGLVANRLHRERNATVWGVDTNAEAIRLARDMNRETPNVFLLQSAYDPLDRSFDLVLVVDIFEHVRDPLRLLDNVERSVAPGGRVVVSTPLFEEGKIQDSYHVKEYSEKEIDAYFGGRFRKVKSKIFHFHEINYVSMWQK